MTRMQRSYLERIDLGILAQSANLAHLREQSLRASIADFRQSSIENADRSVGTEDEEIWRLRISRCDYMLAELQDDTLRKMAHEALDWWERGT